MMGGDIIANSEEGRGSTFTLTFNATETKAIVEPGRVGPVAGAQVLIQSLQGARVLLTDDNAINRQVMKLFLAPQGCVVQEAMNGQHALDRLRLSGDHATRNNAADGQGTAQFRRLPRPVKFCPEPRKNAPVARATTPWSAALEGAHKTGTGRAARDDGGQQNDDVLPGQLVQTVVAQNACWLCLTRSGYFGAGR
jgi:hypothetical protein